MRILITANAHRWYDRTGEIVRKIVVGRMTFWTVRLDNGETTTVEDGQFREVKRQA